MRLNKDHIEKSFYKNKNYYELMERRYNTAKGSLTVEPVTKELIFRALKSLNQGARVLEMGCGVGSNVRWLAERFPEIRFLGSDISEIGISYALQKVDSLKNLDFVVDDIQNSKLEKGKFSLIIAQSVLEHLTDYRKALGECFGLLDNNGTLIIRVGNGGRTGSGLFGFIKDTVKYILKVNHSRNLKPEFVINKEDIAGRREQHRKNFDMCSIPSDILAGDLKRAGFIINSFSTYRELSRLTERYERGNVLQKKLMDLYINTRIFPFSHMGRITILSASKRVM
ncbi:class I SAM-dependent methyltransferase [bacterium]|jgi:2-polyprenyl-3-methyl-5-hydroxy-6-metoxy-1,4-benzoquinol methylase|nr:class I SAM-dependent methyltransferase [bacterium]